MLILHNNKLQIDIIVNFYVYTFFFKKLMDLILKYNYLRKNNNDM